jgi:hypothetical protein
MFEILPISHGRKLFLKANGTLTHSDYQNFITPKVEILKKKFGKIHLVLIFDQNFKGWAGSALWDDLVLGLRNWRYFPVIALVGCPFWVKMGFGLFAFILGRNLKFFNSDQLEDARKWIENPRG